MVAHIALDMAIYMGRYMDNDQQPHWLSFAKVLNFCFVLSLKSITMFGSALNATYSRDSIEILELYASFRNFIFSIPCWYLRGSGGILEHGRVSR